MSGARASRPWAAPALVLLLAYALAACAMWKPGEDPNGREAREQARPVLAALVKYRKERGEYPSSLHELVPHYLAEVPFSPGLRYDRDAKVVEFAYDPSWPKQQPVACGARLGDLDWTCREP